MRNTFYRFKYMRINIISTPVILFILLLIVNIIAFTWFVLLSSLFMSLIMIYFFRKIGTLIVSSKIIIDENGIEWILKDKQKDIFFWEDIIDIVDSKSTTIKTFDLILLDKKHDKNKYKIFRFDVNKEILNVMKSYCTNADLLSKMNKFKLKY